SPISSHRPPTARPLASSPPRPSSDVAIAQGSLFDYDPAAPRPTFEEINLRKRPVRARTAAQDAYIRALKRHALVFGRGPGACAISEEHTSELQSLTNLVCRLLLENKN